MENPHSLQQCLELNSRSPSSVRTLADAFLADEAVDDDVDAVALVLLQLRHHRQHVAVPVYPDAGEALLLELVDRVGVGALLVPDDRGEYLYLRALRVGEDGVGHSHRGEGLYRRVVVGAIRNADPGVKQAEVVVDLGDGPDGGTRVVRGRLLIDRDGRGEAFYRVDVRLLEAAQKLPGIARQRFHVAALPLREDGVEGQSRFARPGHPGEYRERSLGYGDVDVLEVVLPRAFDDYPILGADIVLFHSGKIIH